MWEKAESVTWGRSESSSYTVNAGYRAKAEAWGASGPVVGKATVESYLDMTWSSSSTSRSGGSKNSRVTTGNAE